MAQAAGWKSAEQPGQWVKVERRFRDGSTQDWWALEIVAGPYGPDKTERTVVATTDPQTLPDLTTWYLITNLPGLHAGQIVVMDNLKAHKSTRVKQAIEAKSCQLLFLPGYSPDFSPIEEAFSKLKTVLRRAEARTREALEGLICASVSPSAR